MSNYDKLPYWPAAMDMQTAAAYCGIGVDLFKRSCPVRPIRFTDSTRGERYLRDRLDSWLASMDPNVKSTPKRKFGDRLGNGQSQAARP